MPVSEMSVAVIPRIKNDPCSWSEDQWLKKYWPIVEARKKFVEQRRADWLNGKSLIEFCNWHHEFGLHRLADGRWVFREWLPNATSVTLIGEFSDWQEEEKFSLKRTENGCWEGSFAGPVFSYGMQYKLFIKWPGGSGWRLPCSAKRVVRNSRNLWENVNFNAEECSRPIFQWKNSVPPMPFSPLIYEAHVGMAQNEEKVGTFREFTANVLPRIAAGGYNYVQLMAIMQHPYYASFGYHVTNFYAVCDLFGSPEDFKELVDTAHGMGLRVIMDIVHSHAASNELEGLATVAGDSAQFFLPGAEGKHEAWGSCCFNYGKEEVARFLASNCIYWLEEFHLDGFRFDGITSMLYRDHGLNHVFGGYDDYFNNNVSWDAYAYLSLVNAAIHKYRPDAITIAEDVSGIPGLAVPVEEGGCGFDYRMAMGVTDYWFKLLDEHDEDWNMDELWHEMTNRRMDEKTLSYVECHDQSLVGGQTFLFRCLGASMYYAMQNNIDNVLVDRGMALHKMSRLLTMATAGFGYLNFMGNEFGHPEWIDFPREGNGWSCQFALRRWDLADNPDLKFHSLLVFDHAALALLHPEDLFYGSKTQLLKIDSGAKIIAFERAGFIFCFNFHYGESYVDYELLVPDGNYQYILSSDAAEFGGQDRIQKNQIWTTQMRVENQTRNNYIKLYIPSRVALVLKKIS
ncbi:MAG: alpha amylase C-terminal domain-containing protein [Lentisphaeria bacterium]